MGLLRGLKLGDVAAVELEMVGARKCALDVLPEADWHELVLATPNEEVLG